MKGFTGNIKYESFKITSVWQNGLHALKICTPVQSIFICLYNITYHAPQRTVEWSQQKPSSCWHGCPWVVHWWPWHCSGGHWPGSVWRAWSWGRVGSPRGSRPASPTCLWPCSPSPTSRTPPGGSSVGTPSHPSWPPPGSASPPPGPDLDPGRLTVLYKFKFNILWQILVHLLYYLMYHCMHL